MRRCARCGFPRLLGRSTEWHSDGTVIGSMGIELPYMLLAVDERESIFGELSEVIGFPIEHIFIRAQKNVGRELYDLVRPMYGDLDVRRIPANRWLRPQWLARAIARAMRDQLASTGIGRVSVEAYRAGAYVVLRVANPALIPALIGNCMGIYESVEEMPAARAEHWFEGGDLVIRLTHAEEEPEQERRFYLERVEAGSGPLSYERCASCGVPVEVARSLIWDVQRGILMNIATGEREGVVAVQSIFATFRELEAELGDEVTGILYGAQKKYTSGHLDRRTWPEEPALFWEAYLRDLALRGQGYPTRFALSEDSVSITIANAYEQDLYAAKMAAGLEYVTGGVSWIEWSGREPRRGEYTIATV